MTLPTPRPAADAADSALVCRVAVRAQLVAGMRRLRGLLDHTDVDGAADAGGAR